MYKPWKDPLAVQVKKITAIDPAVVMGNDPLNNSLLEMKSGRLFGPDANEELQNPEIKVDEYFTLNNASTVTSIVRKRILPMPSVRPADVVAQIGAARGTGYDELLDYCSTRPGALSGLSVLQFEWTNDSFEVKRESKLKDSSAAKSIVAEQATGRNVEVKWMFQDWNGFKFQGNLKEGVITTK